MARIRRVDDQREMEKVIDDFVTQGYRIKEQGENSTMMKEKDWGSGGMHLIVLVFLGWWTVGIANAVYAAYKYFTGAEVKIQVEESSA
ncbi:hypothetical protein MUK72_00785 [Halococcus dombrowskii]|uniref:DUF8108 domain-containing protein n=1 Tax=Halococcus dombrowskii TaxID=179637 RepID=A0AAV3SGU9_HALDO|nr:hypothetical protein [Halococcus dombrowskii]UOO95268.1 hypothetical protein MUK72_00785 [Halococcus dombrowskii]